MSQVDNKLVNVQKQRERDRLAGVKHFRVRCTANEFKLFKQVVKAGGFKGNGDAVASLFYEKALALGLDTVNADNNIVDVCSDADSF